MANLKKLEVYTNYRITTMNGPSLFIYTFEK